MKVELLVAIAATVIASYPVTTVAAESGCYQYGDPDNTDLWRFCPDGRMTVSVWRGYFGIGGFTDFAEAAESDNPPCHWQGEDKSWLCEDAPKIVCSASGCWPQ
jgi:hypothetical protein